MLDVILHRRRPEFAGVAAVRAVRRGHRNSTQHEEARKTKLLSLRTTQHVVARRMAERRFVKAVAAMKPSEEVERRAAELVEGVKRAKKADFLDLYRLTA